MRARGDLRRRFFSRVIRSHCLPSVFDQFGAVGGVGFGFGIVEKPLDDFSVAETVRECRNDKNENEHKNHVSLKSGHQIMEL